MNDVPNHLKSVLANASKLADKIESSRESIISLLRKYETHETIEDEISRSVEALRGLAAEFEPLSHPLRDLTISTFFPLNLPLYSLVIFGIAPSAFAKSVFIRPPEVMHEVLSSLWALLDIDQLFKGISLKSVPRHVFIDLYASESDAIIFTGKYENAIKIQQQCQHAVLLYNGSGVNPFVVLKDADLKLAAKKAVEMRCFNSGQDCAGPDAFFVDAKVADNFVLEIEKELKTVLVGNSEDPEVRVSRTIKESYIVELEAWLKLHRPGLVYGGNINHKDLLVQPTIVRNALAQNDKKYHEFFGPVFYILEYANTKELESALLDEDFKRKSMYISIFGEEPALEKKLDFAKLLRNKIVNDVERGNEEYGGYGAEANFVLYGDQKIVKPILISRDLHLALTQ